MAMIFLYIVRPSQVVVSIKSFFLIPLHVRAPFSGSQGGTGLLGLADKLSDRAADTGGNEADPKFEHRLVRRQFHRDFEFVTLPPEFFRELKIGSILFEPNEVDFKNPGSRRAMAGIGHDDRGPGPRLCRRV